ncbi:TauD/TfdA family dioxygenase [Mycobacteroides abscessus]|uniref:TauD/TfdA family dioxygenase n=1 Tax=Mycobacteroides abscessus TaxID=36809 RepID=UPI0012FFD995|nr:TauD/TfdA family dioxygenase [Mycobacteroides abscessus]
MEEIAARLRASVYIALSKARLAGWHIVRGDLIDLAAGLRQAAERSDEPQPYARIVRARSSDDDVQTLRPLSAQQAAARSLSAQFGCGPFPFHTDGAHLDMPPDFVLLSAENAGSCDVPTHLMRFPVPDMPLEITEDMRLGVFRVDTGTSGFYQVCQFADGLSQDCVRFDPGCMSPIDPRSRRLAHEISSGKPDYSHTWREPGEILIIDNHHVLHSRGDARTAGDRVLHRLLLSGVGV